MIAAAHQPPALRATWPPADPTPPTPPNPGPVPDDLPIDVPGVPGPEIPPVETPPEEAPPPPTEPHIPPPGPVQ